MMARTPLQVLEDDVREEARRSTAKKLVALYWAIPLAFFAAALCCLAQIPGDVQFLAVLAAILAAAVGASLGFGLTWTFWVVAKEGEIEDRDARIAELKKRPTKDDVDELKRAHARAIADRDAMISELEKRPTQKDVDDLVRAHAEEIAAKDAVIAKLETDMERRVDEGIKEHMECLMDTLYKKARAARDPDSVIRDHIASRSLDPHSVRVLELVLKTGTVERRWLRDALDRGSVDVTALDLKIHDVGHYFRDLAEERGAAVDPYGRPAARYELKPDVADVLAANREVFKAVEDEDAATAEFLRDYKERTARGEARKAEEGARP